MQKYNIGIMLNRGDGNYIASCGCGTVQLLGEMDWRQYRDLHPVCEKCGNKNFIKVNKGERVLHPYLDVLEKSRKGFKVKRTNLSVFHDKEFNIGVKPNMVQVLLYDLANHKIKLWKNGEEVALYRNLEQCDSYRRFFANLDHEKFKDMVSVTETKSLYNMAWRELSNGQSYRSGKKFYRGLVKLWNYTYLEILSNAGYPRVERFKERRSYYSNHNTINFDGKNPKEIFGLPKFCLKYLREDDSIGIYEIKRIKEALNKVDGNRFRELLEIVKDENTIKSLCSCADTLLEIHDTYGYNNLKKLTLYLFREIRMTQGIMCPSDGAVLLRDYIKMATKLGQEYEKYPKSLKKEHDITMMNYRVRENELKQREFVEAVTSEDYKALEYKKKEFAIVSPKEMQDLINEGNELSHCVASYVEAVNTKKCKIYFMRNTKDLDKSLATIEVRGGNIRQARGYCNRNLSIEEREFVSEWARKKELEENYYY